MYLFYNFCTTLHVWNGHQEFMIYCILQLCAKRANMSNCLVRHSQTQSDTVCTVCTQLQNTVNHELLMMNEMVIRNM